MTITHAVFGGFRITCLKLANCIVQRQALAHNLLFGERRIKLAKFASLRNSRASIEHTAGRDSVPVEGACGACEQRIIVGDRQGTSNFLVTLFQICTKKPRPLDAMVDVLSNRRERAQRHLLQPIVADR
jgi:hypothetical protein